MYFPPSQEQLEYSLLLLKTTLTALLVLYVVTQLVKGEDVRVAVGAGG